MKIRNQIILPLSTVVIGTLLVTTVADASVDEYECPVSPTEFEKPILNPDPASEPGTFPTDLDEILGFVQQNNISSVKELLDHSPDHMRKNYAFVEQTRALGQASTEQPGLLLFGSDGRFMMNIDTTPTSPRYEVVDLAYLNEAGDWELKSLDFRTSPPVLSPDGGNNNECRACHGLGGVNNNGPMKPFWGDYLEWPGFFSNTGGSEQVSPQQASVLTAIENGTQNPDRFHSIITKENRFVRPGRYIELPERNYGISLTVANNEIGSAAAESIYKRVKRSPLYNGLKEEYLALAFCKGIGKVSSEAKSNITDLVESLGGSPDGFSNWQDIIRLWELDPLHEFALHKLTEEYATTTLDDTRWNAGSGHLHDQLSLLVLLDLAEQNPQVDSILKNNPTSWEMSGCGIPFNNQKEYLQHKVYANFTLKGNARQLARFYYYDKSYTRLHRTMDNVEDQLCELLSNNIGLGPSQPTDPVDPVDPGNPTDPVIDVCQQGQTPVGNVDLIAGDAVCLQDVSNGDQIQMAINVPDDKVGSTLELTLSHGSGNADLLFRADGRPSRTVYDQISSNSGNEEKIVVENVQRQWNYIHVRTETEFSGATLLVRYINNQ